MTDPQKLLERLDELAKETGSDLLTLRKVLEEPPPWTTSGYTGGSYTPHVFTGRPDQPTWHVFSDGLVHLLVDRHSHPALDLVTEEIALDDLLAMWVCGLTPTPYILSCRWRWPEGDAIALVSTADGIATEWGIR